MRKILALLFLLGACFPFQAFAMTGSVLADREFAWSDNVGYISFRNVVVTDSSLSGYAWSTNKGFIKFNPARGGVFNDGKGNLFGSAWGEQLGWIDFGGVTIDTFGQWSGTGTGDLAGTITFDCPQYCDVNTDWRETKEPSSSRASVSPVPVAPTRLDVLDQPLIIVPGESGSLTFDTPVGPVILDVPTNTSSGPITFTITPVPMTAENSYLVIGNIILVNGQFYDITAVDADGNPVESFSPPLTITLPIDRKLQSVKNLGLYFFDESNQEWALIPDAVFAPTSVTFQVDHLTRFAIFGGLGDAQKPPELALPTVITPIVPVIPPAPIPTPPAVPLKPVPTAPGAKPVPGRPSTPAEGVITPPSEGKITNKPADILAGLVLSLLALLLLFLRFSKNLWGFGKRTRK